MKTKLAILAGVILAVLSTFAIAGNLLTSPWSSKEFPQGQQSPFDTAVHEKSEPPLVITKDPNILKGKGFFYDMGGTLYKQSISHDGTLATTSEKVATGSIRLVDQSEGLVLFRKDIHEGSHTSENELWVLDRVTGVTKKLIDNVINGGGSSISPQEDILTVVTNDMELLVLNPDGDIITTIGTHGLSSTFSPDGTKIAYIKLKDEKITLGDEDMFQGVAVYDLVTGKDALIFKAGTEGKEYKIVGWSPDGKRIYFPSANDAVWSVDIDGTGKRQETNKAGVPFVSTYLNQLLYTDDGKIVFGKANGVWMFHLGKDWEFLSARKVVEGADDNIAMLSWIEKGKSISVRYYDKSTTTVYLVSDLKR